MSAWFECPYLGSSVELTDEREQHIRDEHRDLIPYLDRIGPVLADPDIVRLSRRDPSTRLFYRWYDDVEDGKYVAVVVVRETSNQGRDWIITAYMSNRASGGTFEWQKD